MCCVVVFFKEKTAYEIWYGLVCSEIGIRDSASSPRTGGVDAGVTYLVFTPQSARVTRNASHAALHYPHLPPTPPPPPQL